MVHGEALSELVTGLLDDNPAVEGGLELLSDGLAAPQAPFLQPEGGQAFLDLRGSGGSRGPGRHRQRVHEWLGRYISGAGWVVWRIDSGGRSPAPVSRAGLEPALCTAWRLSPGGG